MREIWIFLFAFGVILFNWPILSIFNYNLSTYLFIAWFIFILLIFFATRKSDARDDGG
jgi:hypothetical protein